jgi:hypothetical protein
VKSINSAGGFAISGGILNLGNTAADVSKFNALALTGGTLKGVGGITVGNFSQSGGTFGTSDCVAGCFASVDLTGAGPFSIGSFGTLTGGLAASNSIALRSTGALSVNVPALTAPAVTLDAAGALQVGATNISGSLVAGGSDVTVAGALTTGGDARLVASNDVNLNAAVGVGGNLSLVAGNHVAVNDAVAQAAGDVAIFGSFLNIKSTSAPAVVQAGKNLAVLTTSDINLQGGSAAGAIAEIRNNAPGTFFMGALGNINLTGGAGSGATARIFGNPDVNLDVFGTITMTGGAGAGAIAAIESALPTSIIIFFPNLSSGGITINGAGSGFIAGGAPAIPGTNLLISFGGASGTAIVNPPLPPALIAPLLNVAVTPPPPPQLTNPLNPVSLDLTGFSVSTGTAAASAGLAQTDIIFSFNPVAITFNEFISPALLSLIPPAPPQIPTLNVLTNTANESSLILDFSDAGNLHSSPTSSSNQRAASPGSKPSKAKIYYCS